MHFDEDKLINQESYFINIRHKKKLINYLKN